MTNTFSALAVSVSLLALAGVGLVISSDRSVRETDELERLRVELNDLENRLQGLAEGLSERPVSVRASTERDDRAEVSDDDVESSEDGESPDPDDTLLARIETLETRLRGLEGDPIQRAFNYLESGSAELRKRGVYNLESLAKIDPEARAAIHEMLLDADAGVRIAALDTLTDIGDKEVIPTAAELLDDESSHVRREAINTLTRLGAKDTASEIAPFMVDEDENVRRLAVDSMGKLGYKDSATALLSALEDPDWSVRGEAISSLGEIGATESLSTLRDLYADQTVDGADKRANHRVRLAMAMKQLGDRTAAEAEISRLGNLVHYSDNGGAMKALLWIGRNDPAATEVFRKAAEVSKTEWIRREARRVLERQKAKRD